jgi:hypothetical protein
MSSGCADRFPSRSPVWLFGQTASLLDRAIARLAGSSQHLEAVFHSPGPVETFRPFQIEVNVPDLPLRCLTSTAASSFGFRFPTPVAFGLRGGSTSGIPFPAACIGDTACLAIPCSPWGIFIPSGSKRKNRPADSWLTLAIRPISHCRINAPGSLRPAGLAGSQNLLEPSL